MTTSYRGICVLRLSSGEIIDVQVEDTTGMRLTLSPQQYQERGCKPQISLLPDCVQSESPKKT